MMSLGKAVKFPFANGNFNKVLQIGIVFGVIAALEVVINGGEGTGAGTLIGLAGGILFGLFVSGYGVLVMQNIFRGNETLPEFEVAESMRRGLKVFLASLVYAIPIVVVFACMIGFLAVNLGANAESILDELSRQIANPNYTPRFSEAENQAFSSLALTFCGFMLAYIPLAIVLGYAAQIGLVRFAAENRSGALYEFGTNIKLVFSNFGKILILLILQIGLAIVVFAISVFIGICVGFLGAFTTSMMGTAGVILYLSILNLIIGILNTVHQMSNLHLLSGFGVDAGFADAQTKAKNDDIEEVYSF